MILMQKEPEPAFPKVRIRSKPEVTSFSIRNMKVRSKMVKYGIDPGDVLSYDQGVAGVDLVVKTPLQCGKELPFAKLPEDAQLGELGGLIPGSGSPACIKRSMGQLKIWPLVKISGVLDGLNDVYVALQPTTLDAEKVDLELIDATP